jgi:hypothetical protein
VVAGRTTAMAVLAAKATSVPRTMFLMSLPPGLLVS